MVADFPAKRSATNFSLEARRSTSGDYAESPSAANFNYVAFIVRH